MKLLVKFAKWILKQEEKKEDSKPKVYYLRYVAQRDCGVGETRAVVSATHGMTFDKWKTSHPELFADEGFYHLSVTTEFMTVQKEQGKKNEK